MKQMTPEEAGFIYQRLRELDMEKRKRKAAAMRINGEAEDPRQLSIIDWINDKTKEKK